MKAGSFLLIILLSCFTVNGQKKAQNPFTLPKIDNLKFISLPTAFERQFPTGPCKQNLFKYLKQYSRRLTPIDGNQVYLVKGSCSYSEHTCLCFETSIDGKFDFLVVYNPKSKGATLFVCSFDFFPDSVNYYMSFRIRGNEIMLEESGYTEGENGVAEKFSGKSHKLFVLKNGNLRIASTRN